MNSADNFRGFLFKDITPKDLPSTCNQWTNYVLALESDIGRFEQSLQVHTDSYHKLVAEASDYLSGDIAKARKSMEDVSDNLRLLKRRYKWMKAESEICNAYLEAVNRCYNASKLADAIDHCCQLTSREEILEFWQQIDWGDYV